MKKSIVLLFVLLTASCEFSLRKTTEYGYSVSVENGKLYTTYKTADSIFSIENVLIETPYYKTVCPSSWKAYKFNKEVVSLIDTLDNAKDNIVVSYFPRKNNMKIFLNQRRESFIEDSINVRKEKLVVKPFMDSIDIYIEEMLLEKDKQAYLQKCTFFKKNHDIFSCCLTLSENSNYNKDNVYEAVVGQLLKNVYNK